MIAYFSFFTNLPEYDALIPSAQLDYIAFKKGDMIISIGCNWESEYGVSKHIYSGRYKGLEIAIETPEKVVFDWREMNEADLRYLDGATVYEIGMYVPDDCAPKGYFPTKIKNKNLSLEIVSGKKTIKYQVKRINTISY